MAVIGISFIAASVFLTALLYSPLYRVIEANITAKVFYGIWIEPEQDISFYYNVYKKDVVLNITDNMYDKKVATIYYRSDLTQDPKRTRWRVKLFVDSSLNGTAVLRIEAGTLCYVSVRKDREIAGYSLGCFNFSPNRFVVHEIDLTKSGVYEFDIVHIYLWSEGNPPNYPPWCTLNIYLTSNEARGAVNVKLYYN